MDPICFCGSVTARQSFKLKAWTTFNKTSLKLYDYFDSALSAFIPHEIWTDFILGETSRAVCVLAWCDMGSLVF